MVDRPRPAHVHNSSDSSVASADSNDRRPLQSYGQAPEYISLGNAGARDDGFKPADIARSITRTPSPSPSEIRAMSEGSFDRSRLLTKEFWFRKKVIIYVIIAVVLIVGIALFAHYKDKIVLDLKPTAGKLKSMTAGWLIPVAIFVVISFPPLVGHELLALLIGVTFNFWEGFGITALGTLLGDVANFFVFHYFCSTRAHKYEMKNISYACTATVLREGGLWVAVMARYSFIPGHIITTIFATCGTKFLPYLLACVLSLPKQASIVLIGSVLQEQANGTETKKDKIANIAVITITAVASIYAVRFMRRRTNEVKPQVIYNRRKYRQRQMAGQRGDISDSSLERGPDVSVRAPMPQRAPAQSMPMPNPDAYAPNPSSYGHPTNPTSYAPPSNPPPPQRPYAYDPRT